MIRVRNIKGTSNNRCNCDSWISHWEKYARRKPKFCSEINCMNRKLFGAHIQRVDSESNEWFIIPLCAAHNNSKEILRINKTNFVSANITFTCCNN